MIKNKQLKIGEYTINIEYDDSNNSLEIVVLDALDEVIEGLLISDDIDEDEDELLKINLN